MSDEINKSHPPPVFPNLGLPDDRRETPLIDTPRQLDVAARSIANAHLPKMRINSPIKQGLISDIKNDAHGQTSDIDPRSGSQGAPAFALSGEMLPNSLRTPTYSVSTKLHEDFHQMMNRVEKKYGRNNREALTRHLVNSLPDDLKEVVNKNAEVVTGIPSNDHEELIAHTVSYLNSPESRAQYHERAGTSIDDYGKFDSSMKRAYQHFRNAAKDFKPSQLINKAQPTPTFPKLGLPDDRRETPIAENRQQHELHSRAVWNSVVRNTKSAKKLSPEGLRRVVNKLHNEAFHGTATQGETGLPMSGTTAPSYALSNKLLPPKYKNAPSAAVSTKLHEDFHQMMNRIQVRYGKAARDTVAHRLVTSLPDDVLRSVNRYATVVTEEAQVPEELIAHVITYVNSDARRKTYHAVEDQLGTPHSERADDLKMKMALRHFRNKAQTIAPRHIGIKKSENEDLFKALDAKKIDRVVENVKSHLTDDLRKPQYRGKENCLAGHCYVASEAVYHLLGGQRAGWVPQSVQHEGGTHWYLKHKFSGFLVDPTATQFNTPVPYDKGVGRGFLTSQPSKRTQVVLDRVAGRKLAKGESSFTVGAPREVCAVAVFNSDGFLLMGQRNDTKKWNCPGGKMEPGESIRTAALRETEEETGLKVKKLKHLGDGRGGKDGDIIVHCFSAFSDDAPDFENDPDNECDVWEWIDVRGGLPEEFNENTLHNHDKDVLLHILGLQSGKVETNNELSKSWKNAFVGAMAAAGISSSPVMAGDDVKAAAKWTPAGLHEDLQPIAQLESSGGKNVKHVPHSKGSFHTAVGAVGLKPVTGMEEYKKSGWLQKVFPDMHDPEKFVEEMNNNPAFYNGLASAHWQRLKKLFGGDRGKTAYAWRWGIGAAQRDTPEVQLTDPYVNAYQKLYDKMNAGKIGQVLSNPLKSNIQATPGSSPQSQNRIEKSEDLEKANKYWTTPGDIKIPHHTTPERAHWDEQYKQKLVDVFAGGDSSRLRPVKIPISENISGHWVSAGGLGRRGDRRPMYRRMVQAGDPMPPLVVRKVSNGWHVVDGNNRLQQMLEGGRTHADAFELVDKEIKSSPTSKLPKHVKLYDLGEDTHSLLSPKVVQTKYGQLFEPVEMDKVFKKIKKMGYHGYTGHTNNPDEHVLFNK